MIYLTDFITTRAFGQMLQAASTRSPRINAISAWHLPVNMEEIESAGENELCSP
jgi:hypothetical protein